MATSTVSLKTKLLAEKERRRRLKARYAELPTQWEPRIKALFGPHFRHDFSQPHVEAWEWASGIENKDSRVQPFIAIWPRGRGKSTTAEAIAVDAAVRESRHYCMYVSGTQDQADKHVQTIARMLESGDVSRYAPSAGQPQMSRNGNRTWNRQVVRSENYTVESIGLNKAVRGQKIDWARPDLIIFDDIDEKHDTELTIKRKLDIITTSILPAGADNVAVMFMQNLIHSDSIASMLSKPVGTDGAANFLTDRIISGPFPAVENLKYELEPDGDVYRWKIKAGQSIWDGFGIDVCEFEINLIGPNAYENESQHNVDQDNPDALMSEADFERTRVNEHPDLARVAVGVDPPGGATECGIVVGGKVMIGKNWHGYTLEDNTQPAGTRPNDWAVEVLKTYHRHNADIIFVETNFGGDMAIETIKNAKWLDGDDEVIVDGSKVRIQAVRASRGKMVRAEPVATAFQQGRIHHVGQFAQLEREWRKFAPGDADSPNRLDAEVWVFTGLGLVRSGKVLF